MTENTKAIEAGYHYIDAYRVIREQAREDASYPALAKAVSKFVAAEVSAALTEAQDTHRDGVIELCARVAEDDPHYPQEGEWIAKRILALKQPTLSGEGEG